MSDQHPILIAEGLTLGYDHDPDVIQELSLQIHLHDVVGIFGPNGGGKTTLIRGLLGLIPPRRGAIRYYTPEGEPLPRPQVGYVPQQAKVDQQFPITVFEVVGSGLLSPQHPRLTRSDRPLIEAVLERLGIAHLLPKPIGHLSGGEHQRVLLARALISQPTLLVLDEPTTYVDQVFAHQLHEMIPQLQRASALLIVSHNYSTLAPLTTQALQLGSGTDAPA